MMRAALADGVYADLNPDEVRDVLSLLDDLEEALARAAQVDSMREAIESLRSMHTTSARELALRAEAEALRAVAEAARDLAEVDAHMEYCNTPILAEQRGKARGFVDSDNWDDTECDCAAGRARKTLRAALRAWEEREP